jgi:ankyrin repeat protein
MEVYIRLIKGSLIQLSKLPKLYVEDIAKVDEPERMYLYAFYGYLEILYTYNIEQLSLKLIKGNDLFILAIYKSNFELIEYLIANGFDIHNKYSYGCNVYLLASCFNNIKLMEYLESHGLDVHSTNQCGSTAYLLAVYNGHIKH